MPPSIGIQGGGQHPGAPGGFGWAKVNSKMKIIEKNSMCLSFMF